MNEIVFLIEDAPEVGFTALALSASIFTEADTLPQLREAVSCHFETDPPRVIWLHYVRDEVITA